MQIQLLYEIESEVRDLDPYLRHRIWQEKAVPVMDALHAWMIAQRVLAMARLLAKLCITASDAGRRCRVISMTGAVPIDNNWCANQIRPWALGRKNWLFAGSLRSGKRAAAITSLSSRRNSTGMIRMLI